MPGNERSSPRARPLVNGTSTAAGARDHSRHRSWSPLPHRARAAADASSNTNTTAPASNINSSNANTRADRSQSPSRPNTPRRRAYSFRDESPPYEKPPAKALAIPNDPVATASTLLSIATREAQCVAAWIIGVVVLQLGISILMSLASYAYPLSIVGGSENSNSNNNEDQANFSRFGPRMVAWWRFFMVGPSILAGCLLRFIPPQVISNQYPGFIYSSAWLLMWTKAKMGSLPHIPSRICEAVLGRLSALECFVIVGVQMVATLLFVAVLTYTSNIAAMPILSPIEYTHSSSAEGVGNPWIVDYFKELCVTTIFTVALQVVPVLLQLNKASVWFTYLFIYPLYTYGVDSAGQASTLSPSILFALSFTNRHKSTVHYFGRCITHFLAGIAAGSVMTTYFPDDPSPTKRR